jgi:hypothetical protein
MIKIGRRQRSQGMLSPSVPQPNGSSTRLRRGEQERCPHYQVTDGDGDTDTATLIISLPLACLVADIAGRAAVDAERRPVVFWATCGVTFNARMSVTKSAVSKTLSAPR